MTLSRHSARAINSLSLSLSLREREREREREKNRTLVALYDSSLMMSGIVSGSTVLLAAHCHDGKFRRIGHFLRHWRYRARQQQKKKVVPRQKGLPID